MGEPWVTVARREDITDAEWEAAMLREADIPAAVEEVADGMLDIRVEQENAAQARDILSRLDEPEVREGEDEPEDAAEPPRAALASVSPERQRCFDRAYVQGFFGWILPFLLISAARNIVRGWRQPEGWALEDTIRFSWAALMLGGGLLIWGALITAGADEMFR